MVRVLEIQRSTGQSWTLQNSTDTAFMVADTPCSFEKAVIADTAGGSGH